MANSVNLSGLTSYVDQLKHEIIYELLLQGKTIESGVTVLTGLKGTQAIPVLTNTNVYQATTCDLGVTGSITLSQKNVTVNPISLRKKICPSDFEKYFTGMKMKAGSNPSEVYPEFEKALLAKEVNLIKQDAEKFFWVGASSGTFSSNYTLTSGILSYLLETSATASITYAGASYSTFTTATALDIVDAILLGRNVNTLELTDNKIYMSPANYQVYTMALRKANSYHYFGEEKDFKIMVPGTNVEVVSTVGLSGMNKIVYTPASNLVWATDVEHEEEKIEFVEDVITDNIWEKVDFKLGATVYFPQWVTMWNK